MRLSKVFFSIISPLLVSLLIFFNSPSEKYVFSERSAPLKIKEKILSPPNLVSRSVKFTDLTLQSGLFFTHQQGDHKLTGINESLGSGGCVIDYDNDGWQDLFIVNGSGQNRFYGKRHWWQQMHSHHLFKNTGGNHFVNVTKKTGLDISNWGMGCVTADFNNDGYSDLLVTTLNANQLFKNNGNGTFSNIKEFAMNSPPSWSTSACAADFDNDGLVDLYIANYIDFDKTKLNYEGQGEFINNSSAEFFNPTLYNPVSNRLLKNNGDFSFTDITKLSGLTDISSRSLAVRCTDINDDHLPDILVANEKGDGSNRLYINQGHLSFVDSSKQYQFQNNTGSRNISIGDVDNNGSDEIFLTTRDQQNIRLYQTQLSAENIFSYTDVARTWNLVDDISSFQSNWGGGLYDFNQDGLLDIFVVNGFLSPDPETPRITKGQPNQLWLNSGKQFQTLNNLTPELPSAMPESSRSSVFADFDNDGDMDVYISNNNSLGQLLVNESSSDTHWLGIHLVDSAENRNLVDTKVSISSELGIQTRVVSAGDSFLSDSDDRLLFGLNNDIAVKQLSVTWPNGKTQYFTNIPIDQYIMLDRSQGLVPSRITPKHYEERLDLPANAQNNSALFLSLMIQLQGIKKTLPYLSTALTRSEALIRKSALNELAKSRAPSTYALLTGSINDEDIEVAILALDKLCSFEDESTIRWLTSALSSHRDKIRASAAHCFESLFREEEAMIHRKHLSIPLLIKLLTDKSTSVQISSIRALAEAEHYRSVIPLISLLNSEKKIVKVEATRALGLIREKEAIQPLLKKLQDANETTNLFAYTLVALKRLDYKKFHTTLNNFFQGRLPYKHISKQTRINTLLQLYNTLDHVVIPPRSIKDNAVKLINHNLDDELLIKLIPIISPTDTNQSNLLTTLSKNPNPNIRLKAFFSLLQNNSNNQAAVLKKVSLDSSLILKNKLLSILTDNHLSISANSLLPFLADKNTTKAAILALARINDQDSTLILTKELASSSYQALILQSLKNSAFARQEVAKPYLSSSNSLTSEAANTFYLHKFSLDKLLKKMPDSFSFALSQKTKKIRDPAIFLLNKRKELWAIKSIQKILLNTQEDPELRINLLTHYQHPFGKNWITLLKIAHNEGDPIRPQVIRLLSHFDEPKVISFFKALVSNSNTIEQLKSIGLKKLATQHPEWVFNFFNNTSKGSL